MKKLLLLILLISCSTNEDIIITESNEDMRPFIVALNTDSIPVVKTDFNIILSGQSIAQGQYTAATSGYSTVKLTNSGATYLECKTATHTWESFTDKMMSPYQFSDPAVYGCGMEYTLAEYFTNDGKTFNLYKPAWGSQKFGTDASPGKFHVSSDGLTLGEITQDIIDIMTAQKALGRSFDYFLFMHGESDGRDALDSRNAYETNLKRFIDKIREVEPNIPFLIRQIPPEAETWMGAVIAGGRAAINTAIDNVIADTTNYHNCHLVVMPDPFSQGDDIHPSNPTGNDQMALSYWTKLQTLF